jgi:hypothetical protein
VCDWTKPGVEQRQTIGWQTDANGPGGQPLGDAPTSGPVGPSPVLPEVPWAVTLPLLAAALLLVGWRTRAARA